MQPAVRLSSQRVSVRVELAKSHRRWMTESTSAFQQSRFCKLHRHVFCASVFKAPLLAHGPFCHRRSKPYCAKAAKVMGMPGAIESQEADSADAITALCLQCLSAEAAEAF